MKKLGKNKYLIQSEDDLNDLGLAKIQGELGADQIEFTEPTSYPVIVIFYSDYIGGIHELINTNVYPDDFKA